MLSQLSSFLPPVWQLGSQEKSPPSSPTDQAHHDEGVQEEEDPRFKEMAVDEHGVKKKKERTHESFIVVRPPPSKSNHPLNLQLQLVPPSAKDQNRSVTSRRSIDSSADTAEDGAVLSRTSSNRSEASMYSAYTSVTSLSTVGSSSSTSTSTTSSRRMIIPLYNLQAHNVLQNVIVDAGTDAKVARFMKRGLEIIGLAILEPIEVWAGATFDPDANRTGSDGHLQPLLLADLLRTATSSAVSLTSDTHSVSQDHTPMPTTPVPQADRGGARKFLGKIFKKKNEASPPPLNLTPAQEPTPRASKRNSLLFAASSITTHLPSPSYTASFNIPVPLSATEPPPPSATIYQPSILGIQPTLNSPHIPPKGKHPKAYVWVVRRWLKNNGDGLLDRIGDRINDRIVNSGLGVGSSVPAHESVEVRFEWTRAPSKRKRGRGGKDKDRRRESMGLPSNTPSMSSLAHTSPNKQPTPLPPTSPVTPTSLGVDVRRQQQKLRSQERSETREGPPDRTRERQMTQDSILDRERSGRTERSVDRESKRSDSPNPPGSMHTHTTTSEDGGRGDGEESDSEDSETPWTCSIILRKHPSLQHPSGSPSSQYPQPNQPSSPHPKSPCSPSYAQSEPTQPQEVKVKVGAVVPTPHHPKVVALLKIPFPLPDIDIDKAVVRKRIVTPAGIARPALSPPPPPEPNSKFGFGKGSMNSNGSANEGSAGGGAGLVLTAEEIKDVVSCTSLWLVVREGFGGVGKEKRKGDGWRIRR